MIARLREGGLSERGAWRARHHLERALEACQQQDRRASPPLAAFQVPGRIELVGKHVDYAGGSSLVAAVERGISVVVAPLAGRKLVFVDADGLRQGTPGAVFEVMAGPDGGRSPATHAPGDPAWHLYPRTMIRRLDHDAPGRLDGGVVVAFSSSLPQAAGLSSSTALLTALWLGLEARFGLSGVHGPPGYGPSRGWGRRDGAGLELAGYLSALESGRPHEGLPGFGPAASGEQGSRLRGVGTEGGNQDHAAVLLSRAGHARCFRYGPLAWVADVPLPEGWVLVVGDSGVRAEKTGAAMAAYNRLSAEAREAAAAWRARTGGDVPHLGGILDALGGAVAPPWMGPRFVQFRAECEEVLPAVLDALASWEADGPRRLGEAVDRSQQLAEGILGNQVPETVFLARSARRLGAVAASAFGAGFGGAVWALLPEAEAGRFARRWKRTYLDRFPHRNTGRPFFSTPAGPGAFRVP